MHKNTILILDGTFHIFKSYYLYNNIVENSIIYGINIILKKIKLKLKPDYMVIVFDYPSRTYKKLIYNKYKINRKKCSNDFIYQSNKLKFLIKKNNITSISLPNIEADDIIGTISKQCERNNINVLISTCDKDMYQLLSDNIKVIDIYKDIIIDNNYIYNKYGVYSNLIIDYISLIGDYSDNIKGVYGIGHKIAGILLNKIGSLYNIYKNINYINNINEIKNPKYIINKLINYKNNALNAYNLIKLNTDIFIGYKINDMKMYYK